MQVKYSVPILHILFLNLHLAILSSVHVTGAHYLVIDVLRETKCLYVLLSTCE